MPLEQERIAENEPEDRLAMPLILEPSPITRALDESRIPALRRVVVEENDTSVVLTGTVPSYYMKQLAQETIRGLCGERRLINLMEVVRD
jgi:hypothetical protein